MKYSKHFNTKATPQNSKIPGKDMVQNEAGGFSFQADNWTRFNRFLILGTEGDTFYSSEQKLTVENAENVIKVIKEHGSLAVEHIVLVSKEGRAPKNDAAIFALALATTFGNEETKKSAYSAISQVCRTGTHLFSFIQNVQDLRGWSRGLRNGVAKFYTDKHVDKLAYQLVKYRQRNGWTHKDVLRLCHATPTSLEQSLLLGWAVGKPQETLHDTVAAFEALQMIGTANVKQSIQLIKEYNMPWEAIPTKLLNKKEVWEALLDNMPLNALIRNLGKMTSIGVVQTNLDNNTKLIKKALQDNKNSKMHPMAFLLALKTYSQGHGLKGKLSWNPVQGIVDGLNDAFYSAFGNVEATNKNTLVAVDFSGSMSAALNNFPISAREAACAMALVTLNVEPNVELVGYDTNVYQFPVTAKMRLDDVLKKVPGNGCGTDCSMPFKYAEKAKLKVDSFISITDAQSYSGTSHVSQALESYRKTSKVNSKSVEIAMTANGTTNNDSKDLNSITVVGFDTSTPQAISEFFKE